MPDTIGKSTVPKHPTHDVLDSTKIKAYQDCPRKFFFSYVLGWRTDGKNVHIAFGQGWHDAMEHLIHRRVQDGEYSAEAVMEAYDLFESKFRSEMGGMIEETHYAKNASNAFEALKQYAKQWSRRDDFDVLFTETAGTAPIRNNRVIHFKSDAIIEDSKGIWSLEHKTTGRGGQSWKDKWRLDFQVNAYSHALHCIFDEASVRGVKINGAILRKKNNEFLRIACPKDAKDLQLWLSECNHWVDMIERDMAQLAECSPSDDVMVAFPRNPTSCCKFGCSYPGLCSEWHNPLNKLHDGPPVGYEEDFWDPRRREEEARNIAKGEEGTIKKNEEREGNEEDSDENTQTSSSSSSSGLIDIM